MSTCSYITQEKYDNECKETLLDVCNTYLNAEIQNNVA
jgi:hypothetical protein